MRSLDKFMTAMSFEQGPLPLDFGGNPVTGIHCSVVEGLRDFFGLESRSVKIACPYQMLGLIEPDLKEAMGIDTDSLWNQFNMFGTAQGVWKEWTTQWGQTVLISRDMALEHTKSGGYVAYAKGDKNTPPAGLMPESSFFFDALERGGEIDEEKMDWRENTEEFEPVSDELLKYYKTALEEKDASKWIVGNFGGTAFGDVSLVPATMLTDPKGIRGVTDWYTSTILYPDYLHKVFAFQAEIAVENLKKIYAVLGDRVHSAYVCGADFGTQNGPICSPDTYREIYMPYHKMVNGWIHENTNWKTFKHSCGSVDRFIDSFIEAGFDIINPVQWTAAGMEREYLKKKYHRRAVFWGGGVDTQNTLPFGTPEEVRKEVLETCRILGEEGGFVFSSIHNIQAKTPVKNVAAMLEAVNEYNRG